MEKMYLIIYFMAFCFIFIGGKIIITKKPLIFHSRWMFLIILILYIPLILFQLRQAFPFDKSSYLTLTIPLMLFLLLIYVWFILRGFSIIGISSDSFRNALLYALQKSGLQYTETFNKISLPEINAEINIGMQTWMGTGQFRWKPISANKQMNELIKNIREYFRENDEKIKIITPLFYIIFGIIFIIMGVVISRI